MYSHLNMVLQKATIALARTQNSEYYSKSLFKDFLSSENSINQAQSEAMLHQAILEAAKISFEV